MVLNLKSVAKAGVLARRKSYNSPLEINDIKGVPTDDTVTGGLIQKERLLKKAGVLGRKIDYVHSTVGK